MDSGKSDTNRPRSVIRTMLAQEGERARLTRGTGIVRERGYHGIWRQDGVVCNFGTILNDRELALECNIYLDESSKEV